MATLAVLVTMTTAQTFPDKQTVQPHYNWTHMHAHIELWYAELQSTFTDGDILDTMHQIHHLGMCMCSDNYV